MNKIQDLLNDENLIRELQGRYGCLGDAVPHEGPNYPPFFGVRHSYPPFSSDTATRLTLFNCMRSIDEHLLQEALGLLRRFVMTRPYTRHIDESYTYIWTDEQTMLDIKRYCDLGVNDLKERFGLTFQPTTVVFYEQKDGKTEVIKTEWPANHIVLTRNKALQVGYVNLDNRANRKYYQENDIDAAYPEFMEITSWNNGNDLLQARAQAEMLFNERYAAHVHADDFIDFTRYKHQR